MSGRGRGYARRATVRDVSRAHRDSDMETGWAAQRPLIMAATNYSSDQEEVKI